MTDRHAGPPWGRRGGRAWGGPWDGHEGPPWGRHGGPPRFFGCLFGLLFLGLAGVMVWAVVVILNVLGLLSGLIALGIAVLAMAGIGRGFRGTGRTLDRVVQATRSVEAGDYTVRIGETTGGMRSVRELARGFDTMVERLEIDEDQRRRLLADVSHELRTPLAVIAGNVEAMVDGVHPADEAHLTAVLEETRVMERLIDDLRTLALSEAGTLRLHPEPVDPGVLIDEVVRAFEGTAGTAGVTVRAEVPGDLPILDVDPVRVREILTNLVANAIRHTPRDGVVTVRATLADPWLEMTVTDTGPGIDPVVLPHVFDRFVSSPGSGGSGLGLAIARSLAEAHGGSLEVAATGSAGSTFRLRLPRWPPTAS